MEHRMVEYLRVPRSSLGASDPKQVSKQSRSSRSEQLVEMLGSHPAAVIAISIGLGVILGCLIKRR
jgi:ElaB/YqjD/DUF883 family membrane-anchored ribosome-binding protein